MTLLAEAGESSGVPEPICPVYAAPAPLRYCYHGCPLNPSDRVWMRCAGHGDGCGDCAWTVDGCPCHNAAARGEAWALGFARYERMAGKLRLPPSTALRPIVGLPMAEVAK